MATARVVTVMMTLKGSSAESIENQQRSSRDSNTVVDGETAGTHRWLRENDKLWGAESIWGPESLESILSDNDDDLQKNRDA